MNTTQQYNRQPKQAGVVDRLANWIAEWMIRHWVLVLWIMVTNTVAGIMLGGYSLPFLVFFTAWAVAGRFGTSYLWWVANRRSALIQRGQPMPPGKVLRSQFRTERQRMSLVRKQWAAACRTYGIVNADKIAPYLSHMRGTLSGDIVCQTNPAKLVLKAGVDSIEAEAKKIGQSVDCLEMVPRRIGANGFELHFMWSEPLTRDLPVRKLPRAPKGRIAYGVTRTGTVASIAMNLTVLIGGMTGKGKSSMVWALLADLIRQGVWFNVWMLDPKNGMEADVLREHKGKRNGSRMYVEDYCSTAGAESVAMLDRLIVALQKRQDDLAKAGIRKWTPEHSEQFPLVVFIIDECLEVFAKWRAYKPDAKAKTGRPMEDFETIFLSQARSAGFVGICLTQMGKVSVMGDTRDLIAQRVCFGTRNATGTVMILGDDAEKDGAECSKIYEPGVGYSFDESLHGYEKFRSAWVEDEDRARIAEGLLPIGMEDDISKVEVLERMCAVYMFFTRYMECVYVGEGYDPKVRRDMHASGRGQIPPRHWITVDESKTVVVWCKSKEEALALERRMIDKLMPVVNKKDSHNHPFQDVVRTYERPPWERPNHDVKVPNRLLRRGKKNEHRTEPSNADLAPEAVRLPAPAAYTRSSAHRPAQDIVAAYGGRR